jgi:mRNA interferase RelE/StbE
LTASKKKTLKPKHLYTLKFIPAALAEWNNLDGSVKEPLRKLLKKRNDNPHMPGAELRGELQNCYKIKLLKQGYHLIYTVIEQEVVVLVLAVDKREDAIAYISAVKRIKAKQQG